VTPTLKNSCMSSGLTYTACFPSPWRSSAKSTKCEFHAPSKSGYSCHLGERTKPQTRGDRNRKSKRCEYEPVLHARDPNDASPRPKSQRYGEDSQPKANRCAWSRRISIPLSRVGQSWWSQVRAVRHLQLVRRAKKKISIRAAIRIRG